MPSDRISYDTCRPVFPSPAGLITSMKPDGTPNVITLGEVFNLSIREPVIIGIAIAPMRYSHELISREGEFVANLPPASLWPRVWGCGQCSGRATDKFREFNLTPLPAVHVRPPLIAECVMNIECKVVKQELIGDHELFAGEVQAVHVSPEYVNKEGKLDPAKLSAVVMTGPGFFDLGEPLTGHQSSKG